MALEASEGFLHGLQCHMVLCLRHLPHFPPGPPLSGDATQIEVALLNTNFQFYVTSQLQKVATHYILYMALYMSSVVTAYSVIWILSSESDHIPWFFFCSHKLSPWHKITNCLQERKGMCIINRHINRVLCCFPWRRRASWRIQVTEKGIWEGGKCPCKVLTGEMNTCIHSGMSQYYVSAAICIDSICYLSWPRGC